MKNITAKITSIELVFLAGALWEKCKNIDPQIIQTQSAQDGVVMHKTLVETCVYTFLTACDEAKIDTKDYITTLVEGIHLALTNSSNPALIVTPEDKLN